MKTATFSNGHQDTYKGKREIKAAWAIIRKSDGKTLMSGHSLDAAKALKTAEGNFRYVAGAAGATMGRVDRPDRSAVRNIYWNKYAVKAGFRNWKEYYDAAQAELAKARNNVKIEVVAL